MREEHIRQLGTALGLCYSNLEKMKNLPDDMVAAWLRREDDVEARGGILSWSQLADALQEIGQTGTATKIRKQECIVDVESVQPATQHVTPSSRQISINNSMLSESETEDLRYRINTDVEKMKFNFATLQTNVRQKIGDHKDLATHVLGMDILSADDAELVGNATSTNEVFNIISKYWSFIDYDILKNIADTFLSHCHDHEQEMSKYNELLRQFCERRISELPLNFLSTGTDAEEAEKAIVILNMKDPSLEKIRDVKAAIADILNKPPSKFTIYDIGPGSVILTLLVGAEMIEMFEKTVLSEEQVDKLQKINVASLNFRYGIYYTNFVYNNIIASYLSRPSHVFIIPCKTLQNYVMMMYIGHYLGYSLHNPTFLPMHFACQVLALAIV